MVAKRSAFFISAPGLVSYRTGTTSSRATSTAVLGCCVARTRGRSPGFLSGPEASATRGLTRRTIPSAEARAATADGRRARRRLSRLIDVGRAGDRGAGPGDRQIPLGERLRVVSVGAPAGDRRPVGHTWVGVRVSPGIVRAADHLLVSLMRLRCPKTPPLAQCLPLETRDRLCLYSAMHVRGVAWSTRSEREP